METYLSLCLFVSLYLDPSVHQCVHLFVTLFVCQSVRVSNCPLIGPTAVAYISLPNSYSDDNLNAHLYVFGGAAPCCYHSCLMLPPNSAGFFYSFLECITLPCLHFFNSFFKAQIFNRINSVLTVILFPLVNGLTHQSSFIISSSPFTAKKTKSHFQFS